MRTAGLLLAAGAGTRMGGPKALLGPLAAPDRTPLEAVADRLLDAGVSEVVAVIGARADDVRAAVPPRDGLRLVEASDWASGMSASLRTGFDALASTDADAALLTLVDLPDVGSDVYARILAASTPDALARASYQGTPGHPVLFGRHHWAGAAASADGDQGARVYLRLHDVTLIECGDLAGGEDVDSL